MPLALRAQVLVQSWCHRGHFFCFWRDMEHIPRMPPLYSEAAKLLLIFDPTLVERDADPQKNPIICEVGHRRR